MNSNDCRASDPCPRKSPVRAQGDKVYWYEYNILPYYKDTLTKAWYHQPEVEDGIIR